jgi:hypothetical protein
MLQESVTRRQMLKIIAATSGGVAAASLLPEKWVKPFIEAGVIPVHAQTSNPTATPAAATATKAPTATSTPAVGSYQVSANATPTSGNIGQNDNEILGITGTITATGNWPIANISVTLTAINPVGAGSVNPTDIPTETPTVVPAPPVPTLPQTKQTDASGIAHFDDIIFSTCFGQNFTLVFTFSTAHGDYQTQLGTYLSYC